MTSVLAHGFIDFRSRCLLRLPLRLWRDQLRRGRWHIVVIVETARHKGRAHMMRVVCCHLHGISPLLCPSQSNPLSRRRLCPAIYAAQVLRCLVVCGFGRSTIVQERQQTRRQIRSGVRGYGEGHQHQYLKDCRAINIDVLLNTAVGWGGRMRGDVQIQPPKPGPYFATPRSSHPLLSFSYLPCRRSRNWQVRLIEGEAKGFGQVMRGLIRASPAERPPPASLEGSKQG